MNTETVSMSRPAFAFLINMLSTSTPTFMADFPEAEAVIDELLNTRLVTLAAEKRQYLWVDDRCVNIERNDQGEYHYFSSYAGWVIVDPEQLCTYELQLPKLMLFIQQFLGIVNHQPMRCLQDGLIWDLGDRWIGKKRVAFVFVRRAHLSTSVSDLERALLHYPRRHSAVIIADRPYHAHGPRLPADPMKYTIADLLLPDQRIIQSIDSLVLQNLLLGPSEFNTPKPAIWCSNTGDELKIHDQIYRFTGLVQRLIVQQLFAAWEQGQSILRTAQVLEQAHSKAKTVSQAFSGAKNNWREVIGYGQGNCWLII